MNNIQESPQPESTPIRFSNRLFVAFQVGLFTYVGLILAVILESTVLGNQNSIIEGVGYAVGYGTFLFTVPSFFAAWLLLTIFARTVRHLYKLRLVFMGIIILVPLIAVSWIKIQNSRQQSQIQKQKQQAEQATSIDACLTSWGSGSWGICAKKNIHNASDYATCLDQAQQISTTYRRGYSDTCHSTYGAIQLSTAGSINDCQAIVSTGHFDGCAKKFVIDNPTYNRCLEIINADSSKNFSCHYYFAKISGDPTVCDDLVDSNQKITCRSGAN